MTPHQEFRARIRIHYDGTRFFGWQIQPLGRTVQGELQKAVERLTREARTVTGAGRTDRGVHALGQVAAVSLPTRWSPATFRKSMNAVLPSDIWIAEAVEAPWSFHPRRDAVARTYEYRLGVEENAWSPFHRPYCWPLKHPVAFQTLQEAAEHLPGNHSLEAFAKSGQPERGTVCRVYEAQWSRWGKLGFTFRIRANRFLHHTVRYLVGTMVDMAWGRRPLEHMERMIHSEEPVPETSRPAPPQGLFLMDVEYPEPGSAGEPPSGTQRDGKDEP